VPTTTTDQQLTLPSATDLADVVAALTALTTGIESRLVKRYTSSADRAARNPSPTAGEVHYITDLGQLWLWTSSTVHIVIGQQPYGVIASRSTNLTISTGAVTAATFPTATYPNSSMFTAGGSQITLPETRPYLLAGGVDWNVSGVGVRITYIEHAGNEVPGSRDYATGSAGDVVGNSCVGHVYATAGDVVRLMVYQTSGGNLDALSGRLSAFTAV
jgi:hypothetical protein